jgi:putative signal transducing protein
MDDMSQAVPIGSFATRTEAEIVVGRLESDGIEAWVNADDAGGAFPFSLSGGVQVLVDESDVEEASRLLADSSGGV